MGRVILVQHCQSEHHVNEMSGGWTDTPLTELGRRQAQLTAHKLKDIITRDEYVLYSSDLLRASQTAQIIGKHLGLEATPNPGLREIQYRGGDRQNERMGEIPPRSENRWWL